MAWRESKKLLFEFNKALAAEDIDVVLRTLHSMKGVALNLKVTKLVESVSDMEIKIKSKRDNLPSATIFVAYWNLFNQKLEELEKQSQ
ncbi:MAG: Hpt domain-containing protein [Schleiferiaceae bacterium]|nr:Hpt domain-containing protein [Schleiferiaceae bacterium]